MSTEATKNKNTEQKNTNQQPEKKTAADYAFKPKYEIRNNPDKWPETKRKARTRTNVVQYDWPEEAFEPPAFNGDKPKSRKHSWLKRHGLPAPVYAYRVTFSRVKKDENGKPIKRDGKVMREYLEPYECWAVDESEAKHYACVTYGISPTDVLTEVVRVDQGF